MGKADSVFEIIGPVMLGPSSSHTAGAVYIGRMGRALLGELPVQALIQLHGSFALTGKGHGTDKAIVAGLLGFNPDDERIPRALELAKEAGMLVKFRKVDLGEDYHPNTARLLLEDSKGTRLEITASSVGGGNISVDQLNGLPVRLSGEAHTLVTIHKDQPGVVAKTTALLAKHGVNISTMNVSREQRGGFAAMAIEMDQPLPPEALRELEPWVQMVRLIPPLY
jgi:L-serine dehydratase